MHKEHKKILAEIKKQSGNGTTLSKKESYLLSGHFYYDVSVPLRKKIAKEWFVKNKDISPKEFLLMIDSLYSGNSHEEKNTASNLLGFSPEKRSTISIKRIDTWLNELAGWSEIDSLCYNVFTGEELLHKWSLWEKFLHKLSLDTNLNKKRASLVFLAGAVSYSQDPRLLQLSFTLTERLKSHKEIIITKAISWLLRSMVKYHKKEVSEYIKENQNTLPKIAIRETTRKIQTGRK